MKLLGKTDNQRYQYQIINPLWNADNFVNAIFKDYEQVYYLKSNEYYSKHSSTVFYHQYEFVIGSIRKHDKHRIINKLEVLNEYYLQKKDWLLGYFSYDLKNELHHLTSKNAPILNLSPLNFFIPDWVIYKNQKGTFVESLSPLEPSFFEISKEVKSVRKQASKPINLQAEITKQEYINTVQKLQEHIQKGDIYEVNFCQNFKVKDIRLQAFLVFKNLSEIAPTPFACFCKIKDNYLMSASPERYLVKRGTKLISQPIKGTAKREETGSERVQKAALSNNPKEQSENVMIVDLVRNDLSRIAQKGSVKVDELCGIYPFNQVWQMISTISCQERDGVLLSDILTSSFPMGSMTGAPKIRAMELIDQYEDFSRGLFSGSVGCISPSGDFDFNVVIRSVLYDQVCKTASVPVGSAITILSEPELEYQECLLKIASIASVLSNFSL